MSGQLVPAVILDRYSAHKVLEALQKFDEDDEVANALWNRLHRRWTVRGMNNTIVLQLDRNELERMKELGATTKTKVVEYRYVAIYRHPDTGVEVRLSTAEKPPRRKTLRVPGRGKAKFTRVKLYKIIHPQKESNIMARTKTRSKAADDVDELEELEGLEELEDIEAEEPEEDDEEVEEAPKRRSRTKRAAAATKAKPKRTRKAKVVEPEEDDEEDEEDDEEEEPAPKRRTRSKASAASKTKPAAKKKGGPAAGRTTKDITGGVGSAELAEAASEVAEAEITGRDVRVWLRKNEIEKDDESGRYTWPSESNKEFKKLARAIAKDYGE